MKVINIIKRQTAIATNTIDCFVEKGYLQGASGSLP